MNVTPADVSDKRRREQMRREVLARREAVEAVRRDALDIAKRSLSAIHARLDAAERRRAAVEGGDRHETAYRGAADRDNWDVWDPKSQAAEDEFGALGEDHLKLIRRCRDSSRNDPIGAAVVGTMNRMVMGGRPWSVQCTSRDDRLSAVMTPKAVAEWRRACEDVFVDACEHLDHRNEQDFWGLVSSIHRSRLEGGDVFVRIQRAKQRRRGQTPIRLRAYESDLCRTPADKWGERNYRLGVVHADEAPVGYCMFDEYLNSPWGGSEDYTVVKREDKLGRPQMLHAFRAGRLNMPRGLPLLTPCLTILEDASAYEETELIAARAQACVALVIRNLSARKPDDPDVPPEQVLEPGMTLHLQADQEATPFTPTRGGNGTYDAFMMRAEKVVCASLGFSSMLAMQDFTQANYSVARMTKLSAEPVVHDDQHYTAQRFVRPCYRTVIEEAWLDGILPPVPLFDRDGGPTPYTAELLRCMVLPPSGGWIDPTVEVKAFGDAVREGFMSRREVIAQTTGRVHDEVFGDLGEEERQMDEAGVTRQTAPGAAPAGVTPSNDAEAAEPDQAEQVDKAQSDDVVIPDLVLNGAQIQSAVDIVKSVANGELPRDSGIGMLEVLLNLKREQAEKIMGDVGKGFEPKPEDAQEPAPPAEAG